MIIELYLKPTGISAEEAAELCQIDPEVFREIINGEISIGWEHAYKLAKGFNTSHSFWLNLQQDFSTKQVP